MKQKKYGKQRKIYESKNVAILLRFDPRDLWIGAFWRRDSGVMFEFLTVYLCLIPALPIQIMFDVTRMVRRG